jgi:hypothetical protein
MEDIELLLKSRLENTAKFSFTMDPGHVVIRINQEDRHFWSPQLSLTIDENEDGTQIRGLYGPAPNVWTIFLLSYLAIAVLALFALFLGLSYWMLDQDIKILWALPLLGSAAVIVYLIAQFGQKIGAEQTFRLHQFIESTLGREMHIE